MATLFLTTDAPTNFATTGTPVNVGMAFFVSAAASVVGLRFYKNPSDPSTAHTLSLWDVSTHALLAQKATSSETASGWQEVTLTTPYALTTNKAYRVSCFTSDSSTNGYYGYSTTLTLSSSKTNGLITAYATGTVPSANEGNCTYDFNSAADYPTTDSSGGNYFVDINISAGGTPNKITASIAAAAAMSGGVKKVVKISIII